VARDRDYSESVSTDPTRFVTGGDDRSLKEVKATDRDTGESASAVSRDADEARRLADEKLDRKLR